MIYWVKVKELWALCVCLLRQFSVSPRMYTPILPDKLQKITKRFQCGYKTKINWNTERIMQFFKIAAYVQITQLYGLVHYAACAFLPYINSLWLALVGCGSLGCFMRSWLVWALRVRERERVWRSCVFVSVDVKCIIHYRRMCKFICSL